MMGGLSAEEILNIWEAGQSLSPTDKVVTMLAAACPDMTLHEVSELDIARRDLLLLDLREKIFGNVLRGFSECPQCFSGLEFESTMGEIRALDSPGRNRDDGVYELCEGDSRIRFRLPNSRDLSTAIQYDRVTARSLIARRCVTEVVDGKGILADAELTEERLGKISVRMAEYAPLSDILMDLLCPTCGYRYQAPLDLASFLWSEISSEARQLLYEVHLLARTYGWRESDILRMSPARRNLYLEMVTA